MKNLIGSKLHYLQQQPNGGEAYSTALPIIGIEAWFDSTGNRDWKWRLITNNHHIEQYFEHITDNHPPTRVIIKAPKDHWPMEIYERHYKNKFKPPYNLHLYKHVYKMCPEPNDECKICKQHKEEQ